MAVENQRRALTTPQTMWARRTVRQTAVTSSQDDAAARGHAFRLLVEGSLVDAYKLAGAILRDRVEAEDAVHDAFVLAWQKWPSLRDQSRFDAWFRMIVVNVCRERLRRTTRRRTQDLDAGARVPTPSPPVDVHDRLAIEQALARLGPDDRVVLALRYYHDLRVEDLAAALYVQDGTVYSRRIRAMARLRQLSTESQQRGGSA